MASAGPSNAPKDEDLTDAAPAKTPLGSVRRSLTLSFAERYLGIVIQFAATVTLARMLTPGDYGVYTIGLVIVNITSVLRDFGAVSFLIQEKNLSEISVRTAYGMSLLIGFVVGCVIVASSGVIASFYDNDALRPVLLVLGINFVLAPFVDVVFALLRREMNFRALFWISVSATTANTIVAITLAFLGAGAMSLAWGALAASLMQYVMARRLRPRGYDMSPSLKDWRRIGSFGIVATAGILCAEIGGRAPELVIGRFINVPAVGIYGRANGLIDMFNRLVTSGIAPVAVSAFAMQHRGGGALRDSFIKSMTMLTGIAWPFFVLLGLMAGPITRILFGSGWDSAIPIARILCVVGCVVTLAELNWYVLQATGAMQANLRLQLITQPVKVALLVVAAHFGLAAVAGALIVSSIFWVVVSYHSVQRIAGTSLGEVLAPSLTSVAVTACSAVVPALVLFSFGTSLDQVWLPFCLSAAGAAAGWFIGLRLFRHPLGDEIWRLGLAVMRQIGMRLGRD